MWCSGLFASMALFCACEPVGAYSINRCRYLSASVDVMKLGYVRAYMSWN